MNVEASALRHPSSEAMAAFLDGGLPPRERLDLAAHLDACPECRYETVEAARLIPVVASALPPHASGARRWLGWAGLGVAAAAALVILSLPGQVEPPSPAPEVRGEELSVLRAKGPADGAILRPGDVTFAWSTAGEGALYRFTLSDEAGHVLWTTQLRETRTVLPPAIASAMPHGTVHYWRVDALLSDLHSISTGDRRLITEAQ